MQLHDRFFSYFIFLIAIYFDPILGLLSFLVGFYSSDGDGNVGSNGDCGFMNKWETALFNGTKVDEKTHFIKPKPIPSSSSLTNERKSSSFIHIKTTSP